MKYGKFRKNKRKQTQRNKFPRGKKGGNRFSKGVSRNPAGRPKLTRLSEALREQLSETMLGADDRTVAEAVARALIREALTGNVQAIREVFDRSEGRARVTLDVGNKDGEPLLITFNFNSNARLKDVNE